jgi:hypothetical protein
MLATLCACQRPLRSVGTPRAVSSATLAAFTARRASVAPKIFEPRRRQLCVAYGMLNGPMAEPILNSPRVVAGVRQGVAAAVAEPCGRAPGNRSRRARQCV